MWLRLKISPIGFSDESSRSSPSQTVADGRRPLPQIRREPFATAKSNSSSKRRPTSSGYASATIALNADSVVELGRLAPDLRLTRLAISVSPIRRGTMLTKPPSASSMRFISSPTTSLNSSCSLRNSIAVERAIRAA